MYTVTVDTCVLIDLLENPDRLPLLWDKLAPRNGKLVIPYDVVCELILRHLEGSWERAEQLRNLLDQEQERAIFAAFLGDIVSAEPHIRYVPKAFQSSRPPGKSLADYIRSSKPEYEQKHSNICSQIEEYMAKDVYHSLEKDFRKKMKERSVQAQEDTEGLTVQEIMKWAYEGDYKYKDYFFSTSFWRRYVGLSKLTTPDLRYRCRLMFAMCTDMLHWGLLSPDLSGGKYNTLGTSDRNNVTDNRIAAASAYSRYLLTKDHKFKFRTNRAAGFLGLALEAVTWEEFLDRFDEGTDRRSL